MSEPSVSYHGQISPTLQFFDDGEKTYSRLVDNANSNTRIGVNIKGSLGKANLLINFETALGFPQSSAFSKIGDDPDWVIDKSVLRFLEARIAGSFGIFAIGQGSMATDGSAGANLAGTGIAGTVAIADSAGAYRFRDGEAGALTPVTISSAFSDLDGSRRLRLRYDTPEVNGFSGAIAWGQNALNDEDEDTYYDAAVYYADQRGGYEVAGSVGYGWREKNAGGSDENWVASFAVLHVETGINGAVAGGAAKDGGSYGYGKVGYRADWVAVGPTNLSIDYYEGNDFGTDGSSSTAWGLQVVQVWDDLGLEGYAGYREYAYDDKSDTDFHDAQSTLAGLRWKF